MHDMTLLYVINSNSYPMSEDANAEFRRESRVMARTVDNVIHHDIHRSYYYVHVCVVVLIR